MNDQLPGRSRPLRVCYFGTYRKGYSRNIIMIEALCRAGVDVFECHAPLWHGIEDRVQLASGGWRSPSFWIRVARAYLTLIARYSRIEAHDLLVVGYPGQFDVFLARLLSWLNNKPLVWDVFMSIYLVALERSLDQRSPNTIKFLKKIEKTALGIPNLLIQDTQAYVQWLVDTHGISPNRFRLVPTGADDRIYLPAAKPHKGEEFFRVTYYGTFIPNHGVSHILLAARQLVDYPDIQFEFIGQGPELASARQFVNENELNHVTFQDWLERSELVQHVSNTDLCLGAFGNTPQSIMTIQNKIYEGLAMQLPVITGDSPTMRQTFEHKKHLYLVSRSDPADLAAGILELKNNQSLRQAIAFNGYTYFQEHFSLEALGNQFASHLHELYESSNKGGSKIA